MTPCRTCHLPWDNQSSNFTICPACRAKMPVRRVNTKPLNRRWKPLPEVKGYGQALDEGPNKKPYNINVSGITWTNYRG